MVSTGDTAFIIMTGAPQDGKRERISKVRSHITKRYFERQHQKLKFSGNPEHVGALVKVPKPHLKQKVLSEIPKSLELTLPPELSYTVLPANHPMRDETFFKLETELRMKRCEYPWLPISEKGNCLFEKYLCFL
jgi:hypothetical protein